MFELLSTPEVGDLDFKWFKKYGNVFRARECYGVRLFVSFSSES
jgi:hypothetical protein